MNTATICAINFAPFARRGILALPEAKDSLRTAKERTNMNTIILTPCGLQETAQSEQIDYRSEWSSTDDELKAFIDYAHSLSLQVLLKPTVNCKNGTWRAHISFFEEDVPCEPKWGNWFDSYCDFQSHFAGISEEMGCEMHIAGCEMVMSEHRAREWREVIGAIRREYHGAISYNTDKYQEHNVTWWDCVDVISSSGYYPIHDWERQLDRIENVVHKFQKPFFFAETGCMSAKGSPNVPNDWAISTELDLQGQADWYEAMFSACKKRDWVGGFGLWSWPGLLPAAGDAVKKSDYDLYCKPAEEVVRRCFTALA